MTGLVRQIASVARRYFPQTRIVLEIADDFGYSATDPMELASVAAELNASVVMIDRDAMPPRLRSGYVFLMPANGAASSLDCVPPAKAASKECYPSCIL
jgi:hypothetical protein